MTNSETPGGAKPRPAGAPAPSPSRLPLLLILLVLAVFTRFYELGDRPLHHDESIHAFQSHTLATRRDLALRPRLPRAFPVLRQRLDLQDRGPSPRDQYDGATSARGVRAHPDRLGVAPRAWIGKAAAAVYAVLVLVSPHMAYFSRFIREDLYSLVFTLGTILAFRQFLETDQARWLTAAAVLFALAGVTKENAYMTGVLFVVFGVWIFLERALAGTGRPPRSPSGSGRAVAWAAAARPARDGRRRVPLHLGAHVLGLRQVPGRLAGDPEGGQVLDGPARDRADPRPLVLLLPAALLLRDGGLRRLRAAPAGSGAIRFCVLSRAARRDRVRLAAFLEWVPGSPSGRWRPYGPWASAKERSACRCIRPSPLGPPRWRSTAGRASRFPG